MEAELLSLVEFCGGALQEKTNKAIKQVIENMMDPNTPWKKAREVNIKLTFTQNEDRDDTQVSVAVTTKTAPSTAIETRMAIGKDLRTGEIFAQEYGKQIRGQMSLDDLKLAEPEQVVVGKDVVDTETGEITGRVVDFRETKQA